jgi:hypothetical protein
MGTQWLLQKVVLLCSAAEIPHSHVFNLHDKTEIKLMFGHTVVASAANVAAVQSGALSQVLFFFLLSHYAAPDQHMSSNLLCFAGCMCTYSISRSSRYRCH